MSEEQVGSMDISEAIKLFEEMPDFTIIQKVRPDSGNKYKCTLFAVSATRKPDDVIMLYPELEVFGMTVAEVISKAYLKWKSSVN